MNAMSPLAQSSLLVALTPSEADRARQNLRNAVTAALEADAKLRPINDRIIYDPNGDEGHRQEMLIMQGQLVIEAQFELATGMKLDAVKRAMGW